MCVQNLFCHGWREKTIPKPSSDHEPSHGTDFSLLAALVALLGFRGLWGTPARSARNVLEIRSLIGLFSWLLPAFASQKFGGARNSFHVQVYGNMLGARNWAGCSKFGWALEVLEMARNSLLPRGPENSRGHLQRKTFADTPQPQI